MKYMKQMKLFLLVCVALLFVSGCATKKTSDTVAGRWVVDFTSTDIQNSDFESLCDDDYDFLHSFTLYEDGTYSTDMVYYVYGMYGEQFRVDKGVYNGHYAVVHDGTSIAFDETSYYQIEQDKDTLILHGENGGTYVYRRNNIMDEMGIYQLKEVQEPNGDINDTYDYTIELREDFGLGVQTEGEYVLNTGNNWGLWDGKVVLMYGEEPNQEGVLVGDTLTITDEDGRIYTYEHVSSYTK